MHIQLGIVAALLCTTLAWADPKQGEIKKLFAKYEQIVEGKKDVKIHDVFTKKFVTEAGGEKSLLEGWEKEKKGQYDLTIKPSRNNRNRVYVQRVPAGSKQKPHSSFVVVKEQGQWRIEGTIGDEE
jgi:hypothetical protein